MEESKEGFKRCSKCGRVLPLADFNKRKSSKDGLQYYCKDCQKAMHAEWHDHNKEKKAAYDAEYYQSNKEKIAAYNAEWRAKNPTYNAEWYQTHRDSELKRAAEWRAKNPTYDAEYYQSNKEKKADYSDPQKNPMNWAKRMVANYRQMDRERFGYDSKTITAEWFLEHIAYQPCAHCGKQGIGLIGCNRLDNTKPHTIDNVEPCCQSCNFSQNIRDQIRRGIHVSCKHKKQSFSDFVKEHLNEKSKK